MWTTLGRPHGLHFFLDLTDPEQRDIAKDIVKLAIKTTVAAKAAAKAKGLTQVCVCVCTGRLHPVGLSEHALGRVGAKL